MKAAVVGQGVARIAGVEIAPGDLLHGDANGVTTLPDELIPRIAQACRPYCDGEQVLMDALDDGSALEDGGKAALAKFAEHYGRLKRQLGVEAALPATKPNTMV